MTASPGNRPPQDPVGLRREAHVHQVESTELFRVTLELYPEHEDPKSVWYNGRILWGFDQEDLEDALHIAYQWTKHGFIHQFHMTIIREYS